MRRGVKPNTFLQYIPLIGVAALLVFTARILLIVLRLFFCLGALIFCILVLHPESYKFVPDNDELYASHVQPPPDPETLIVPKILHQTYKTEDIPEAWRNAQSYCRELHSDFEYMFWTDSSAHAFVARHYRWFLPTYERYPHAIQRVDALRYLLLHHYGGVYMDLDVGCRGWRLDRLLQYPLVLPTTDPTGFSNDVMVSVPRHPLLHQMIHSLHRWNHIYGTKYPTVMFSTGPMFLTIQYMLYRYAWPASHQPVELQIIADARNDAGEGRDGGELGAERGGTLNVHTGNGHIGNAHTGSVHSGNGHTGNAHAGNAHAGNVHAGNVHTANRKVLPDPAGLQRLPHGIPVGADTHDGHDASSGDSGRGADGGLDSLGMESRGRKPGETMAQQAPHTLGVTPRPTSQKNRVLDEKHKVLDEKNKGLDEKNKVLDEKHKVLDEKHKVLDQKNMVLDQKNRVLGANLRLTRSNALPRGSADVYATEQGATTHAGRAGGEREGGQPRVVDLSEVWALPYELYGHNWKSFFVHYKGNSWHGLDSALVFWLYHNLDLVFLFLGVVAAAALLGYVVCCQGRRRRRPLRLMHKKF